jgi:hypothetical protein
MLDWLKHAWDKLKEPLEEAAKSWISKQFAPYIAAPAAAWEIIAKVSKPAAEVWKEFARANPAVASAIVQGFERLAIEGADQINPTD